MALLFYAKDRKGSTYLIKLWSSVNRNLIKILHLLRFLHELSVFSNVFRVLLSGPNQVIYRGNNYAILLLRAISAQSFPRLLKPLHQIL